MMWDVSTSLVPKMINDVFNVGPQMSLGYFYMYQHQHFSNEPNIFFNSKMFKTLISVL